MITTDPDHPTDRPDPDSRRCDECGHVWFAGERHHEYVDVSAERHEDIEVLCTLCLQKRRLARREP